MLEVMGRLRGIAFCMPFRVISATLLAATGARRLQRVCLRHARRVLANAPGPSIRHLHLWRLRHDHLGDGGLRRAFPYGTSVYWLSQPPWYRSRAHCRIGSLTLAACPALAQLALNEGRRIIATAMWSAKRLRIQL